MSQICKIVVPLACLLSVNFAYADSTNFKRWAVSAGWMHVMPQGKANSTHVTTAVEEGGSYGVGSLWGADLGKYALNGGQLKDAMGRLMFDRYVKAGQKDPNFKVPDLLMKGARADISGISDYTAAGGMEAEDTDTLGLTLSYFVNDNVSLELVGGIPPKVDIKGVGEIRATALSTSDSSHLPQYSPPTYFDGLELLKDTLITDLGAHGTVAEVTAWTPAVTAKYHFGTSGKNKFRPFVGAGVVYGHFNKLKLNGGVEEDLIQAGYMIDNILNGRAGEALHGGKGSSTATPEVQVKTSDAFAPVLTAGFTYDFTDRWFSTGSLSYMPNFNNVATVTVTDTSTGRQLIKSTTKIDLDPLVTYVGVGYRF
ncbi:OmpW family protein [Acinetobacter bouvetii]|uniref:OmpW family protein n=1 Tax=Acinetobacter bouvetii TaxID=202951 RepID=A0A4Q7AZR5_9GAMM|nr:OmpW family outer membrane protein [Acinetobacter bouvetii]RZG67610.1 OmpW family protein [Acinetobacter bouvetii]